MDAVTVSLVLFVFFFSAFLKGITGLGFSTVCLGILASLIDIKTAIPLVIIPSVCSNVLVMIDAGRFREAVNRFWPIYLSVIPGLVIGLMLLGAVDSIRARAILGAVLFLYGVWALWNGDVDFFGRFEKWLSGPVGFLTGIINGITGSQVMPVLPYLFSLNLGKNLFVQSINVSFTLSSVIMFAGVGKLGLLTSQKLGVSAVGILPVLVGIYLGVRIRRRMPEERFRNVVLVILIGLGLNLIVR